jgi:hypothetical protein
MSYNFNDMSGKLEVTLADGGLRTYGNVAALSGLLDSKDRAEARKRRRQVRRACPY